MKDTSLLMLKTLKPNLVFTAALASTVRLQRGARLVYYVKGFRTAHDGEI